MKPRIGIIPGDPSGIGPELIARLLTSEGVSEAADILLIGDSHVFTAGQTAAGETYQMTPVDVTGDWRKTPAFAIHEMDTIAPDEIKVAEATEAGFEVGTRTSVDVLLALRSVFEAQRDYARSRYDYLLDTLRLKRSAGMLSGDDLLQIDDWLE